MAGRNRPPQRIPLRRPADRRAPRSRLPGRDLRHGQGYDNTRVFEESRERGVTPIICLRKARAIPLTPIPYGTGEWKRLYKGRGAVEREFGRLKNEYGLAPLRTRGFDRVRIHADLTMLARLGQALARARAIARAA